MYTIVYEWSGKKTEERQFSSLSDARIFIGEQRREGLKADFKSNVKTGRKTPRLDRYVSIMEALK